GHTAAFVNRGSREIEVWDISTKRKLAAFAAGGGGIPRLLAIPRGEEFLACGTVDGEVRLWDLQGQTSVAVRLGDSAEIGALTFSEDGTQLAAGPAWGLIRLWRVPGLEPKHELRGHTARVMSLAFSPDGKLIASGSADRTVRLWDTVSGTGTLTPVGS